MLEYIFTPKGGSGEDIYLARVDGCAGLLGMILYVVDWHGAGSNE